MGKKLALAAVILLIIGYSVKEALPSAAAYVARVLKLRRDKNSSFRTADSSPIAAAQRAQFDSLKYFTVRPELLVSATLQRHPRPDTVLLQTSTNEAVPYLRWGQARFDLGGQMQQLTLFRKAAGSDTTLFVPFTDASNGHSTYGGGRYLDVPLPPADTNALELDFNLAYNPYCAYSDEYSCPVPPAENRLPVAIEAGEKAFHD